MAQLTRLAFVGNSFPRRCGIATFTTDLQQAVAAGQPGLDTCIVAMSDHGQSYDYPPVVRCQIRDNQIEDYIRAAELLNSDKVDVVSLQHEFGIFGGAAGGHVLTLLERLAMPVVTTFHTILPQPSPLQHSMITRIAARSARIVVMSDTGRDVLASTYAVGAEKIEVIPHGIPDFAFVEPDGPKAKLGFGGRQVILTFGLLSPNKGIEVMIEAMPAILQRCPEAVYVVLGATHPNLVRDQGEAYRARLIARVQELGIAAHVVFYDQFVELPTLLDFIAMCDVYVTPYLDAAQSTSGTLAYSFGLGKAVISTPYGHASELLAEGRGILVPFGDAETLGEKVIAVLSDRVLRDGLRARAYASSRPMTWNQTARRYLGVFEAARRSRLVNSQPALQVPVPVSMFVSAPLPQPQIQLDHFLSMCDDTGIFQHAVHSVPDRAHGYCVDDNARALLFATALGTSGAPSLPDTLTARFAAFVQHAWNPDNSRFRNFMSYARNWLEEAGSEDSHGRTLWALGDCARYDESLSRRQWAADLFAQAMQGVAAFRAPRAWAFTLLGLHGYCAARPGDEAAQDLRKSLSARLMALLAAVETAEWVWFEDGLAYDNARLCQALLLAGAAMGDPQVTAAGARTLRWLMAVQTAPAGHFRPVGSNGFGEKRIRPQIFDQQPLEAAATIAACRAAARVTGDATWLAEAERSFDWFLGHNDLRVALIDPDTGSCRDGLHPDRANENRGGESILSYLLAQLDIRQMRQTTTPRATLSTQGRIAEAHNRMMKRGRPVTNHISESPGPVSKTGSDTGDRPALQTRD